MRSPVRAVALVACLGVLTSCSYTLRNVDPIIPPTAQSSTVYAADGTLITTFHAEENRQDVKLGAMPLHLRQAVIAIEDERFYRHKGVDLRAIIRAARTNAESGSVSQGGSTITQQYVKNVLIANAKQTISRKVEEAQLALQLERKYTKDRILELYLNTIYFGNGAYGVQAAAKQYFGKNVGDVDLAESALLAGLIQAPSRDDPFHKPLVAIARRGEVLDRMVANGFATAADAAAARAEPLKLGSQVTPAAERYPAAYFVEEVKQWILHDSQFGPTPKARRDLLFGGGLRIETTVDLAMQSKAEAAVAQVLTADTDPSASLVSIEPGTGYVKAMVGGRDFFGPGSNDKLNLATQGPRQAGSSFKPLVLAAALEQGVSLSTVFSAPGSLDIPQPDGAPTWHVSNYGEGSAGDVSLLEATVHSYNTVYAQLIMKIGPKNAMSAAHRLGITSKLLEVPSAVLGANNVTALEMASAYSTFANRGVHVAPVLVTKITNANGTILYEHEHAQKKVLDATIADEITSVLEQVIQRGTGTRANIGRPAAGKTGTAQEWKDAWFAGYTPDLATAVWIGFPKTEISMTPPHTRIRVTGGTWPAMIWQRFMSAALTSVAPTGFHPPSTTSTTAVATSGPSTSVNPQDVEVPNVLGLSADDATAILSSTGFTVQRITVKGASVPTGHVAAQSPLAGSSAPPGSEVTIEISGSGAKAVVVPDVGDMTEAKATATLQNAGFEAVVVNEEGPNGTKSGRVWKQSPAAGTWLARGGSVTIHVSP